MTLELKLSPDAGLPAPAPVATTAPQPAGDQGSGRRTAAYVIGAAGIAGLAIGGITGGLAMGKKGLIGLHCGSAVGSNDDHLCDVTGRDAVQSVGSLGLASTIGFVIGAAGTGTGIVLLLTAPKPQHSAAGTAPQWLRAGVLSAGTRGALLGAQGAW